MANSRTYIVDDVIYRFDLDGTEASVSVRFPPWSGIVVEGPARGIEVRDGRIIDPPAWMPRQILEAFEEANYAQE
jgi:hypothetical protein